MIRKLIATPGWWPVAVVFAANGVLMASWAPHIPYVRAQLDLSEGQLGVALLCMAIGALVAMIAGGWVASRVGSRVVTRVTSVALCLAVPLPIFAPSYVTLMATLALVGGMTGAMDVSMNALGARVESSSGRKVMGSLHGMFSVGAILGAGGASAALAASVPPPVHIVAAAAVVLAGVAIALLRLPAAEPSDVEAPSFVLPRGPVLGLGFLALLALAAEGSVFDWGSTLLRDDFGATAAVAALAYGVFNVAMAVTRFAGDGLREKWGNPVILATGGAVAAVGLAAGLLSGNAWVALVGFGLMGLGLGNAVPVLFVAGAERAANPELGVAGVATLGYFGFLVGPPSFGGVAELIGLPAALGIAVVMCAVLALGAGLTKESARPAPVS